jgi:hypothetical protein
VYRWLTGIIGSGDSAIGTKDVTHASRFVARIIYSHDATAWTTNRHGGDGFVLKFDMDGNFKLRISGTPTAPASNDTNGGLNGTPTLYRPADMVVDPKTNRLYVADG